MKKVLFGIMMVLMGILVIAPGVMAYPVSAGDSIIITQGIGGANNGGAYKIDLVGDSSGWLFDTFCLEKNEYFTLGGTSFIGSITDGAIKGGVAGGNPDPLSSESAYLMFNWANWTIDHTAANANAIQDAIWFLEEEITTATLGAAYVAEALSINHNGNLYGIQVMNLYGVATNMSFNQDMLVYNPVPEPATLVLLGLGLVGLAGVRRKIQK